MKYNPKNEWRRLRLENQALEIYETLCESSLSKGQKLKLLTESETCETYGDLRNIFGIVKHAKELKDIAEKGGKAGEAAKTIIGLIPGGAAFINWAQTPAKIWKKGKGFYDGAIGALDKLEGLDDGSADLKKAGGILDALKIDDGYQKMTDDKLEQKFFDYLAKELDPDIGGHADDEPLPDKDINEFYEEWLSANVGSTAETVTGASTDTKFKELPKVQQPTEFKKSVDRIGGALKGSLGKFLGWT